MLRAAGSVLAALLLVLTTGCGDTQSYTRRQVERAFAKHGFDLQPVELPDSQRRPTSDGTILEPVNGTPFVVIVAETNEDAAQGYDELRSQATNETFDIRRGNVVATSDRGTSSALRKRIRAALAALPPPN